MNKLISLLVIVCSTLNASELGQQKVQIFPMSDEEIINTQNENLDRLEQNMRVLKAVSGLRAYVLDYDSLLSRVQETARILRPSDLVLDEYEFLFQNYSNKLSTPRGTYAKILWEQGRIRLGINFEDLITVLGQPDKRQKSIKEEELYYDLMSGSGNYLVFTFVDGTLSATAIVNPVTGEVKGLKWQNKLDSLEKFKQKSLEGLD